MRVAIYARTALPDQTAIKRQTEALTGQIRNMWGNNTEIDIYADNGVSGLKTIRPGLQELLQKAGTYNGVFVWDISRLSRSVSEVIRLYKQLKDVGTGLYTAEGDMMEIMDSLVEAFAGFST